MLVTFNDAQAEYFSNKGTFQAVVCCPIAWDLPEAAPRYPICQELARRLLKLTVWRRDRERVTGNRHPFLLIGPEALGGSR